MDGWIKSYLFVIVSIFKQTHSHSQTKLKKIKLNQNDTEEVKMEERTEEKQMNEKCVKKINELTCNSAFGLAV